MEGSQDDPLNYNENLSEDESENNINKQNNKNEDNSEAKMVDSVAEEDDNYKESNVFLPVISLVLRAEK